MRYKPLRVVWEITWKCNLKCMHCGSDCISVEKSEQLTTAECLDIVADLKSLGTELITLSGGEPLLRKDFATIAAAIKSQGMDVAFISNGLAINDENVKLLQAINPIVYGLSMDSADEWMHDYIRGHKGCFEHLLAAINLLQEHGVKVGIVTTVHRLNFTQLPKIRNLLLTMGVDAWQIQYADFIGRMPHDTMITEAQYWEMAKFILDIKQNYSDRLYVTGSDSTGYMSDFSKQLQGNWYGCHAGIKVLGIGSDGTLRGCLSQQMDKFIEGNVRERSLVDIWNDPNKFEYNRHFDCSMLTGYCKECLYGPICKGGCVIASTNLGDCRCNPYCLYKIEKEGYSSEEQARLDFSKEEIAAQYNQVRELPPEFYEEFNEHWDCCFRG